MIEIKMPRLSDTMEEGAVATWRKQPGDTVAVGDVLVEIETDKAVMEYEAYQAGTLARILVPEGENADIGAPIALLDDGTGVDDGTGSPAPSAARGPDHQGSSEREQPAPFPSTPAPSPVTTPAPAPNGSGNGRQLASPLVRKLARDNHLDLSHVAGTGPGGRIIRADLAGLLAAGTTAPPPAAAPVPAAGPGPTVTAGATAEPPAATVTPAAPAASVPASAEAEAARGTHGVPVSQVRRVIARRLSASAREIPHFYVTAVADAQDLTDLRAR